MAIEQLNKLDPRRTIHLRGFDRRGAAAAIHSASAAGFEASGVFRSPDDFAVVVVFKRDNLFEHHSMRYLPDGDLSGITLDYDYAAGTGLAPLDSVFFESIPNRSLSFIRNDRTSGTIPLFEHATLKSGAFTTAEGIFDFTESGGGFKAFDRVIIWYLNLAFEYSPPGPTSVEYAFFNAGGTGVTHSITTPTTTYNYVQQAGDSSGDIANQLVALVNAGAGDPDVTASIGSAAHIVRLDANLDSGASFLVSAVDGGAIGGGGPNTLYHIAVTTFPKKISELINAFDWVTAGPSLALIAEQTGAQLKVKAARFGTVDVAADGVTVTHVSGAKFQGLPAVSKIYLNGVGYDISTVDSNIQLTLSGAGAGGALTAAKYLAERGGRDGNFVQLRRQSLRPKSGTVDTSGTTVTHVSGDQFDTLTADRYITINSVDYVISSVDSATQITLAASAGTQSSVAYAATQEDNPEITTTQQTVQLAGGDSDVTWTVSIDFSALGVDALFEAWLTLAPPLTFGADFIDTEFDATFSNWSVTDPGGVRPLKIAGPGSVRIGNREAGVSFEGSTWNEESGFFDLGFVRASATTSDRARVKYSCQFTHDLYLGTQLVADGGIAEISLDSDTTTDLDTYFDVEPAPVTVRPVRSAVPAGTHELTVTVSGRKNAGSSGFVVYFDHIEAVVASDVQDPAVSYPNYSAATDYDTDATYKIPPQRLRFQLERLGFLGDVNHFIGNFFHYQRRKRAATGKRNELTIDFGGVWKNGDSAFVDIGGVVMGKSVFPGESSADIARHFEFFVNETFVGVFAERTGAQLVVKNRANLFGFTHSVSVTSAQGTATAAGSLAKGTEGIWEIDDSATLKLNHAARKWHEDFFSELQAGGLSTTVAYNMEGYNPPETATARWAARYFDSSPVRTAVGFGTEGEGAVLDATNATPIEIRVDGHGFGTGDEVLIADVLGNTAANGTFTITVVDADRFTLDGSVGSAGYTSGGEVRRTLRTTHLAPNTPVTDFLKAVYLETADLAQASTVDLTLQLGEALWWFFSDSALDIVSATATTPIRVTIPNHGFTTGDEVIVAGLAGLDAGNGTWTITVINTNELDLDGSDGSTGANVSGVGRAVCGSTAFYDEDTKAAASVALGRPLVKFTSQDSDPAVNSFADADFLRDRLETHLEAIVSHVRATYANQKFELLYPYDVLHPDTYHTNALPFPQGGRLNHHVSTPPIWKTQADANRRLKIEALSWGAFYRNLTRAQQSIELWKGPVLSWPESAVTYLVPWFNGGAPWEREYLTALRDGPMKLTFWALDHKRLLEWRELPRPKTRSSFQGG